MQEYDKCNNVTRLSANQKQKCDDIARFVVKYSLSKYVYLPSDRGDKNDRRSKFNDMII